MADEPTKSPKLNGRMELTDDQVRTIRACKLNDQELARRYGVSASTVYQIRTRLTRWNVS